MSLEIEDKVRDIRDQSDHIERVGEDGAVAETIADGDIESAVEMVMDEAASELDDLIKEMEDALISARNLRAEMEREVREHAEDAEYRARAEAEEGAA